MAFQLHCAPNQVWYGSFSEFDALGIPHGVTTRLGGVSPSPYQSLNFGMRSGDVHDNVALNRQRFFQALSLDISTVVSTQQIHSDTISVITSASPEPPSNYSQLHSINDTDGLLTNIPGVTLMIFFADCLPLLFYDERKKIIGACHAGWRGTALSLASSMLQTMEEQFDSRPSDCWVGIGPSIGPCCYEVGDEVVERFQNLAIENPHIFPSTPGKPHLDLWEATRHQLLQSGVLPSRIIASNVCTACNTEIFYSYRAEKGKTGIHAAVISL